MIKNIIDLTVKEMQILKTSPVTVTEMLDGLRFKVVFSDSGYMIKTAKGKVIDEVDYIVNGFYRDVVDYMKNVITPNTLNKIIDVLGKCEATFIYIPEKTYNVIVYNNYTKHRVVLCSLYTEDKDKKDILWLYTLLKNHVAPMPIITEYENGLPAKYYDDFSVYELVSETYSGNDVDDIEGVVLSVGEKNICKIIVNPTTVDINPTVTKLYRDTVIEDFAKVMRDVNLDEIFNDDDSYVDCICNMFYEYINKTDIKNKVCIEAEDLLPPAMNNVGDLDLDALPSTAKLICSNKFNMNVLRLLLVTFNTDNYQKFQSFSEPVISTLMKIIKKINGE